MKIYKFVKKRSNENLCSTAVINNLLDSPSFLYVAPSCKKIYVLTSDKIFDKLNAYPKKYKQKDIQAVVNRVTQLENHVLIFLSTIFYFLTIFMSLCLVIIGCTNFFSIQNVSII